MTAYIDRTGKSTLCKGARNRALPSLVDSDRRAAQGADRQEVAERRQEGSGQEALSGDLQALRAGKEADYSRPRGAAGADGKRRENEADHLPQEAAPGAPSASGLGTAPLF